MARAGPSRTQRSQRAPQPSQSQSQRPARGSRRAPVEEDEDEDAEGDDDQDMDINGRLDDADAQLDRKASDLVRFALFMEQRRTLIRREDINKKVLASNSRSFNSVFERAQKLLKKTFAMELVELQSRNYREQDNVVAGDDLQEARNAIGVKKKSMLQPSAAAGSKTYILRSVLDPVIIEAAARTDERLYEEQIADSQENGDDDDDMPRSYGCIISWSTTDQVGALGVLHVILAIILASGRSMTDLDLRAHLKRLGLASNESISMNTQSTHKSLPIDTYLGQLMKQGYLDRIKLGDTKAAGGKRSRAPAATQTNPDENQAFEWHWGHRSYSEIGEQAIATFIAEFMVERSRDDDAEDDDDDDGKAARSRGKGRAGAEDGSRDKKLKNVYGAIERAAGGNLSDVK
ncbi:MAGE-domain-containing protein [Suillus fuscotomentosus]|uniref:MAGE-domain-containing protein n=1 Tax=Suillus fuscotomentosus TaxID=1912939 RepID=A0AAD4DTE9_9AGAM|nr:MAGE-domain-containing protein [Suillus fuscotomentosus]KAG1893601.1 MAGE-domain-containing protein [Suillus fuscotomentosus]